MRKATTAIAAALLIGGVALTTGAMARPSGNSGGHASFSGGHAAFSGGHAAISGGRSFSAGRPAFSGNRPMMGSNVHRSYTPGARPGFRGHGNYAFRGQRGWNGGYGGLYAYQPDCSYSPWPYQYPYNNCYSDYGYAPDWGW